jgi:D-lactate dehydrogenase
MRKMLTPNVRAIGPPADPAQDDAVDPARVQGSPATIKTDLIRLLGTEQVVHRTSDLIRYVSNAATNR